MTNYEKLLFSLLPSDLPSSLEGHEVPSLSHCVGTGKLIGALYGTAIIEELGLSPMEAEPHLSELSVLLRAYIVLDDFARDHNIRVETCSPLHRSLINIRASCCKRLDVLCNNGEDLLHRYISEYEEAYSGFSKVDIWQSIIKKCCLISLPFELDKMVDRSRNHIVRLSMMRYLFALQMMDDFQDMEEDLGAPRNHNIFTIGLSTDDAIIVQNSKHLMVKPMFFCVEKMLTQVLKGLVGKTAKSCVEHSLAWVRDKKCKVGHLCNPNIFSFNRDHFTFDVRELIQLSDGSVTITVPDLNDICAESMHTVQC